MFDGKCPFLCPSSCVTVAVDCYSPINTSTRLHGDSPLIQILPQKPVPSSMATRHWGGLMRISDSYHSGHKSLTLSLQAATRAE